MLSLGFWHLIRAIGNLTASLKPSTHSLSAVLNLIYDLVYRLLYKTSCKQFMWEYTVKDGGTWKTSVSVTFTVSVWLFVTEWQPNDFPWRSQWPPLELIGPEGMLAVLVLLTGAEYNWIWTFLCAESTYICQLDKIQNRCQGEDVEILRGKDMRSWAWWCLHPN